MKNNREEKANLETTYNPLSIDYPELASVIPDMPRIIGLVLVHRHKKRYREGSMGNSWPPTPE